MGFISARATRGRPRPAALVVAASLVLLLAACAESPDTGDEATEAAADDPDDPEATAPAGAAGAGSELLAFTAETVEGEQFKGAELGGQPVALWFWAPW